MCHTAILDKATTFEYFYPKPFWVFDWIKLGLSGAVIRWSWFCLGLPCPHLFVQPRFWPFHAQLDTLQPQKCWLQSNQHYHHIWLIRTAWKSHLIKTRSCLMEYGAQIQLYFQCCLEVVLRQARREGCLSSKSLLDGERPGPLSPGLDLRATNCILA